MFLVPPMGILKLLSASERCRAAWCPLVRLHSPKGLGLGFVLEVVGLHMTNASQQERGRNAEKPAALLRTERAPGLVPVEGNGVC